MQALFYTYLRMCHNIRFGECHKNLLFFHLCYDYSIFKDV